MEAKALSLERRVGIEFQEAIRSHPLEGENFKKVYITEAANKMNVEKTRNTVVVKNVNEDPPAFPKTVEPILNLFSTYCTFELSRAQYKKMTLILRGNFTR